MMAGASAPGEPAGRGGAMMAGASAPGEPAGKRPSQPSSAGGWSPPRYPYDRLEPARRSAAELPGGVVDLSVGTPTDPPPEGVLEALASPDEGGALRGYPSSAGSLELRQAIQRWVKERLGASVPLDAIAACVGTKELVAALPGWLKLRYPQRDTVLYPAVSYPTYAMGAELAGLRAVPVPLDAAWHLDLAALSEQDASRALLLWANTPGNPAGGLDDLAAIARWGLERGVPVFSDECYCDYTWEGPPRSVLGHGSGADGLGGVVAVHSLSKRSNLAGLRVGWYCGDAELVGYLREVRKHAGLMAPGPAQRAAAAALSDSAHVEAQRQRYLERLVRMRQILSAVGVEAPMPQGGFYIWAPVPGGDAWAFTERMASEAGMLVSPGEFYGPAGAGYVRLAMVAPLERLDLVASRLGLT